MKLFYRKFGKGPNLVILHGLYGMSDNWMTIGKKLADHFELILVDQRNHGQSPHNNTHTYEAMRDDLLELYDDQGIKEAHLIGHSMGGETAMLFASDYPERVKSLIAVDISPRDYMKHPDFEMNVKLHSSMIEAIQGLNLSDYTTLNEVERDLSASIPDKHIRQFLLKNLQRTGNMGFRWKFNIQVLGKEIRSILAGMDEKKYIPGFKGSPALFIRGKNSNYLMDEDIPWIKRIYPGVKIETIDNAGHMVHAEQPELFIELVRNFLSEIES
ncbi:MAG: alpha/beta fold hydrolase [Bacteroidales bacterium]|nr:alpha/beta fold hydrolase [Bacteroidales bacterium]